MNAEAIKRKFKRNRYIVAGGMLIYGILFIWGFFKLIGLEINLTVWIIYLTVILFTLYLVVKERKSYPYKELKEIFTDFNTHAEEEIFNAFGEEMMCLFWENPFNKGNLNGISSVLDLLKKDQAKNNDAIKYILNVKVGQYYSKDGQFDNAIDSFNTALLIKTDDFLSQFYIARCYERMDNGEKAIQIYEQILEKNADIDRKVLSFIQKQINRINESGPDYAPPIPGLQYLP